MCWRWFRSRGGLAVHRCDREKTAECGAAGSAGVSQGGVECRMCGRTFNRRNDLKRHKCRDERSKPVQEQRGSLQCPICEKLFKSAGDLGIHKKKLHSRSSTNAAGGPRDPVGSGIPGPGPGVCV